MSPFAFHRFWAVVLKEFVQMKRDRLTFAMMIGIPLIQLTLLGLPSTRIRSICRLQSLTRITGRLHERWWQQCSTAIISNLRGRLAPKSKPQNCYRSVPSNSSRLFPKISPDVFLRGERPTILIEADATDPAATGPALAAMRSLADTALDRDLRGPLARLKGSPAAVNISVHAHYNPENNTQYNVVPGLMGVVLTMTMIIITSLAITRERERGTMENLLATPARPIEVMAGKILPYILVGYVQVTLILIAARFIFHVPMVGSLALLYSIGLLFIAANLAVGITFSTLASNQLQAMQMAFFFFLPSILLSGFMFPFRGMPIWAQWLGTCLPLTHFLRIVRGILLKGSTLSDIAPELWPLALFVIVAMTIGVKRYRQTLD